MVFLVMISSCFSETIGEEVSLKEGDYIQTLRSGKIYFLKLKDNKIFFKRELEWIIPAKPKKYSIGNKEYLIIKNINYKEKIILVQLSSRDSSHPLDF
jgi:hypothetical protein